MAFISFFEAQSVQTESNGIKIITKSSQTLKKSNFELALHPSKAHRRSTLSVLQAMDLDFLQEASAESWMVFC